MREWTEAERLAHEKAALGFYVSGHPYAAYADELAQIVRQPLSALQPKRETTLIAGIVTAMRMQTGRRGKMAFVTLDDGGGSAEMTVYSEVLDAARTLLREDQLVIAEVKVGPRQTDDGQVQGLRIIAEAIFDLAAIRKRHAKGLRVACNGKADRRPAVRAARAVPRRELPDRRRVQQPRHPGRDRAAPDLARQPRRAAAGRPRRVAVAGERARRLLTRGDDRARRRTARRRERSADRTSARIPAATPPGTAMTIPAKLPATMRYIAAREPGPPDVLTLAEGPVPTPKPGEVLVAVSYAGVNRPDCLQRAGAYPPPADASPIIGLEVAGTIVACGAGRDRAGRSATASAR